MRQQSWMHAIAIVTLLGVLSSGAMAQHLDVQVSTSNGPVAGSRIQISAFGDLTQFLGATGTLPIHYASGNLVFPTWFTDSVRQGVPTTATDNPGFQAFAGTFSRFEEIRFRALGELTTWSPVSSAWSTATGDVQVRLSGGIPDQLALDRFFNPTPAIIAEYAFYEAGTRFTGTGVEGPVEAPIGVIGSTGAFHDHWDWFLEGSGRTVPAAYLVQVQIFSTAQAGGTDKYLDSPPFYVLFNNKLSNEQFNTALLSLTTAPVPEPESWALLIAGVLLVAAQVHAKRRLTAPA
jgi:hypothetical protein